MSGFNKQELRLRLRASRKAIPQAANAAAAQRLCALVCSLSSFQHAQRMAFYWPHDGEISTIPLISSALAQHSQCFLPVLVLDAKQQLAFAAYTLDTPMVPNRYGILEPELSFAYLCEVSDLDLIFVPVVGFDSQGQRLGMGGGYYDATFASNLRLKSKDKSPQIIGLAYSCQHVEQLPTENWDWSLNAVVTEDKVYNFKKAQPHSC